MREADVKPLQHVLDTMQGWIAGEPVWPYAKIIEAWGNDFVTYRQRMGQEMLALLARARELAKADDFPLDLKNGDVEEYISRSVSHTVTRGQWVARFGFAIPCAELLDELERHQPIVEIGAGTGYMTRLMRCRGITVVGTDANRSGHGFKVGAHDDLQVQLDGKTAVRRYPHHTVFCSWPTLKSTWFRQALRAMNVGQKIIVIREEACAEDTAWKYLAQRFEELATISIPTFNYLNDYAQVCVKRNRTDMEEIAR